MPLFVPALHPVKISDLRPTQITVGYHEVAQKRKSWRERVDRDGPDFLGRHSIPVIMGRKHLYMIDHHHLALALYQEGVEYVLVNTVADLHHVDKESFWTVMDINKWCHPYNKNGERVNTTDIPESVEKLEDDPYRSLAGELRRQGGFAKDITTYSEFLWADFLRRRIKKKTVVEDFDKAVKQSMALAKISISEYLPGWCGCK